MAPDEYNKALDKAFADLEERVQRRQLLNAEIAGLRETVRVLANIAQVTTEKRQQVAQLLAMVDYATPSLTDAVRALLTSEYPKEMTAIEVRNALDESSNSEDFNNSLSACHAALKRIVSEGQAELGPLKNGKASYRRVLKLEPPPGTLAAFVAGFAASTEVNVGGGALSFLGGFTQPKGSGLSPPPERTKLIDQIKKEKESKK